MLKSKCDLQSLKEVEILWIELNSLEAQIVSIKSTIKANEMAVEGVKKENEVAYLRYASVYKEFSDVSDFEKEAAELN